MIFKRLSDVALKSYEWSTYKPRFWVKGWDRDLRSRLPNAYKKFYNEWFATEPEPVHWTKDTATWKRDQWGYITPVQNVRIPIIYPDEHHDGIWGGEGVIKGYRQIGRFRQELPLVWIPDLQKTVLYSEVLDKHIEVVVTQRALTLIDQHYGLDFYLLKSRACDLKSKLALKLKREILLSLARKTYYPDDANKQREIDEKYRELALPEEDADWYGLTIAEATKKQFLLEQSLLPPVTATKHRYRLQLLDDLKQRRERTGDDDNGEDVADSLSTTERVSRWISKANPFQKGKSDTTS